MTDTPTVPAHVLPHRTYTQLLRLARAGLAEATDTRPAGLRYATAHLAALRAATAVLAARGRPATTERRRLTSVWVLLAEVAPELSRWAEHFATGSSKRAAAEAGIPRAVTPQEADDLVRAAGEFVTVVETALGVRPAGTAPPGKPYTDADVELAARAEFDADQRRLIATSSNPAAFEPTPWSLPTLSDIRETYRERTRAGLDALAAAGRLASVGGDLSTRQPHHLAHQTALGVFDPNCPACKEANR